MSAFLIYLILLRIIHIVAGVCWVGGAIMYTLFLEPAAKATAPGSGQFVQHLISRRHLPVYMSICSLLTVVAGGLLYWHSSGGFNLNWITSGPGSVYTIGSAVAIVVFFVGLFMIKPRAERLSGLGHEIGAAGGVPTPAQTAELQKLGREMTLIGRVDVALLAVALLSMATARYWLW
jgi:uncharacterized membrane protein